MRARKGEKINGLLLLDKPLEVTSNGILQRIRRLFGAQKAGHTGALDPLASGVLPICFGEATKFSSFGLEADKAYIATGKLGEITETGDSEGEVISRCAVPESFSETDLEILLKGFVGTVHQVPSMYSALKYEGRPLYEYARKGIEVPRKGRDIQVFELELKAFRKDSFDIYVRCSKGTYIRTLVEDIGKKAGCGAHVTALRRVGSGPFTIAQCLTEEEVKVQVEKAKEKIEQGELDNLEKILLPVDEILQHLPEICLGKSDSDSILQGQTVRIASVSSNGVHRVYNDEKKFIGLGSLEEGMLKPKRLIAA